MNGYLSAAGPTQTSESSPVRDRRSTTTEPPNQLAIGDPGMGSLDTNLKIKNKQAWNMKL